MTPLFAKPVKKQTMAEQMAGTIREAIVDGRLEPGAALPTEAELAEQFDVSRAVVRDATRILMAWGLVDVEHGRGVFVTESQTEGFGEALLLTLQRAQATAWDVEQFHQLLLPEVAALAATAASDDDLTGLRRQATDYLTLFTTLARTHGETWPEEANNALRSRFEQFMAELFAATHNALLQQLARPLWRLRNVRRVEGAARRTDELLARETAAFTTLVDAIATRDPAQARAAAARFAGVPPQAVAVLQQTPVGEAPMLQAAWFDEEE